MIRRVLWYATVVVMGLACHWLSGIAQENDQWVYWNLDGGLAAVRHQAQFDQFAGLNKPPTAPPFESLAFQARGFLHGTLWYSWSPGWRVGIGVGYVDWSTVLRSQEVVPAVRIGDSVRPARFEHQLDVSLPVLSVTPAVGWKFGPLHFSGGIALQWVLRRSYSYWEEILEPQGATFITGGHRQLRLQGTLPLTAFPILSGWVQLAIPLVSLSPSAELCGLLQYQQTLSSVLEPVNWSVQTLKLGLQLQGAFLLPSPPPVLRDTVYYRDTTEVYESQLVADTVLLQSKDVRVETRNVGRQRVEIAVVRLHYVRKVPVPQPLLSGSLDCRVVLPDGREDTVLTIVAMPVEEIIIAPRFTLLVVDDTLTHLSPVCQWEEFVRRNPVSVQLDRPNLKEHDSLLLIGIPTERYSEFFYTQLQQIAQMLRRCFNVRLEIQIQRGIRLSQNTNVFLLLPVHDSVLFTRRSDTLLIPSVSKIRFYLNAVAEAGVRRWKVGLRFRNQQWAFQGFGRPPQFLDWNLALWPLTVGTIAEVRYYLELEDMEGKRFRTAPGLLRILPTGETQMLPVRRYRFVFYPELMQLPLLRPYRIAVGALLEQVGGVRFGSVIAPGGAVFSALPSLATALPVPFEGYYPLPEGTDRELHPVFVIVTP